MTGRILGELIDRYAGPLALYARQWCRAAEDVVQEAFVKLVRQQSVPADVPAWLYRVVKNAAIDAGKSARRRQAREEAVAKPDRWFAEAELNGMDAATAVEFLQSLPGEEREIIVAHLWGGLNFEQMAAVAGCSTSTAFRRYEAGIDKLRKRMGVPCSNQRQ